MGCGASEPLQPKKLKRGGIQMNIVNFSAGRSRPQRAPLRSSDGARILFFTGVRYARGEEETPSFVPEATPFRDAAEARAPAASEAALDHAGR